METTFLVQPDIRLGDKLFELVRENGLPDEVAVVSAFASLTGVLRFKELFENVVTNGGDARLIVGIDLGGTSKQVLKEVASWASSTFIYKNSSQRVTFHPKIYFLRWSHCAYLITGSNNLTDGGLYRNYEASAIVRFDLPADAQDLSENLKTLDRFLTPSGPTANYLDQKLLASLLTLPEIPNENDARVRNKAEKLTTETGDVPKRPFQFEKIAAAPSLPSELQRLVLAARMKQRDEFKKVKRSTAKSSSSEPAVLETPLATIDATTFYVHLPSMKADNRNLPGEMRVPLIALEVAPDFWGWEEQYKLQEESPRAGKKATEVRTYHQRRANWRTYLSADPANVHEDIVRMYMYDNSSDFRMMIGALNRLKGRKGDIIKIQLILDDNVVDYECILAPQGTKEHKEWEALMPNVVSNSPRKFGYS